MAPLGRALARNAYAFLVAKVNEQLKKPPFLSARVSGVFRALQPDRVPPSQPINGGRGRGLPTPAKAGVQAGSSEAEGGQALLRAAWSSAPSPAHDLYPLPKTHTRSRCGSRSAVLAWLACPQDAPRPRGVPP